MVQNSSSTEQLAAYTKLLAKDPRSTIFVPLCEAYRQAGRFDEALVVANRGIMENPSLPAGYVALGRLRYQQGATDQAADEFEKALILDNNNLAALKGLAKVRLQQKDREAARPLLRRILDIDPRNSAAAKLIFLIEQQRPVTDELLSDIALGKTSDSDQTNGEAEEGAAAPIATVTIAEIYIRQGLPEKALKVYRDLLRVNPHDEQLRQKLIGLNQQLEQEKSTENTENHDYGSPPVASDTEVSTLEDPAATEDSGSVSAAKSETATPLLEVLTGWMNSINRRRASRVR